MGALFDKFMLAAVRRFDRFMGTSEITPSEWVLQMEFRVARRKGLDVALMQMLKRRAYRDAERVAQEGADPAALHPFIFRREPEMVAPMHVAARYCCAPVVGALLKHKGVADTRDAQGRTPLMHAGLSEISAEAAIGIADLLLKAGADINAREASGATAIHFAAWASNVHLCRFLMAQDADPDLKDKEGRSARDIAAIRHISLAPPPAPTVPMARSKEPISIETAATVTLSRPLKLKMPARA